MATYNKDRHLLLTLDFINKDDLRVAANKEHRSVNNFINLAIKEKIEGGN